MCLEQSDVIEEDTNFDSDAIGNNLKNFFAEEDDLVENVFTFDYLNDNIKNNFGEGKNLKKLC